VKEKKYPEAVSSYDKIAKKSAGTELGAEALFSAAQLRAWYDNPSRDLSGALQRFDEFLKHYPEHEKAREAQNWRYYIKTVLDLRRDNEQLTRNIEQLKNVDIRHEERRKTK
jgi:outer membrane protein assembly factor BamD (BamD/ComL family)